MRYAYTESIITRKPTSREKMLQAVLLVLIVLSALLTFLFQPFFIVAVAGLGFVYYKSRQNSSCEYEYVHTNDDFDIDMVTNNSARKQLVTVDLNQVVIIAPLNSDELEPYGNWNVSDFSGGTSDDRCYAMVCTVDNAKRKLILQLDSEMHRSLKLWIPSKVK